MVYQKDNRLVGTLQQLLEKSIRRGDCLIWQGSTQGTGYGKKRYQGKLWTVHRLAYTLLKGEIPQGLKVLHRCDTPACWRVDHLFLGSQRDNLHDAIQKGRAYQMIHALNSSGP